FLLKLLRLRPHGQGILLHRRQSRLALGIVIDATHEGVRNLQLDTIVSRIGTGDATLGLAAGEMLFVNVHLDSPYSLEAPINNPGNDNTYYILCDRNDKKSSEKSWEKQVFP